MRSAVIAVVVGCAGGAEDVAPIDPFTDVVSVNLVESSRAFAAVEGDFAAVREIQGEVVLVSTDSGSLSLGATVAVGQGPRDVVAIDWQHDDGVLEVVTADTSASTLTVLRREAGGFEPMETLDLELPPNALATGDVDGDGEVDLVVSEGIGQGGAVEVLSGATGVGERVAIDGVARAGIGDVDGDGDADVVACLPAGDEVAVLRNDGTGSLVADAPIEACDTPLAVAVADLDGAAPAEILVACIGGARILRGTAVLRDLAVRGQLYDLAVADFDGNGAVDLAGVDVAANELMVWPALAPLELGGPSSHPLARGPVRMERIDFDRDGDDDLAVLAFEQRWLQVLVNGLR
jgi:VCBS repeat protein